MGHGVPSVGVGLVCGYIGSHPSDGANWAERGYDVRGCAQSLPKLAVGCQHRRSSQPHACATLTRLCLCLFLRLRCWVKGSRNLWRLTFFVRDFVLARVLLTVAHDTLCAELGRSR